jgi:hypothetical protein
MRLWSLYPKYLDRQGLLGCWSEALLAKNVLLGKTRGYKNHPQLERFKDAKDPIQAIDCYLIDLYCEGKGRDYNFDKSKVDFRAKAALPVTDKQIDSEAYHLYRKLLRRDNVMAIRLLNDFRADNVQLNRIFYIIPGEIESWERV